MNTPRSRFLTLRRLTLACSVVLAVAGCQKKGNHDEWVRDADTRWEKLRTGVMVDMAYQQFRAGQLDVAEKTVRDAMKSDPDAAPLHLLAGRISLERGQLERAYHLFGNAITLDDQDDRPYFYQAIVLQRWQQYDKALEYYELAYEHQPDNPSYLLASAEMLAALDRMPEAIALLESKMTYFDSSAAIRAGLGHFYALNGDDERSAHMFAEASMLHPDDPRIEEELALAQVRVNKPQMAIRTLEKLLAREDSQGRDDLWRTLAGQYVAVGKTAEARQVYVDLTRRDPTRVDDWVQLGELAWKLKDYGSVLAAANRIVHLAPKRHEGYLLAGMVWHRRGRLEEALRMFDQAAELAPDSATPLILRGVALQGSGKRAAAADAYLKALERQPDDLRAQRLYQSVAESVAEVSAP